jgi:uncharacterized protein YkwD
MPIAASHREAIFAARSNERGSTMPACVRGAAVVSVTARAAGALLACAAWANVEAAPAAPRSAGSDPAQVSALIVRQTNAFRAANRLEPLKVDARLAEAAQRFAQFMASEDRYGHDADGRAPAERARAHGYEYCALAENIGYQFSSAGFTSDDLVRRLVEGWERSPGHRRNMLLPNVVDIGVGVARSARTHHHYAVQMFGRPRSEAARFELSNRADVAIRYELGGESFTLPPRVTRTHEGCFSGEVRMQWPDGATGPVLDARHGGRYTVVREGAELRVQSN